MQEVKIKYNNGLVYEGQAIMYIPNGKGYFMFPDGSFYSGFVLNGLPHGPGLIEYEDKYFTGFFKNGLKNGKGALINRLSSDKIIEGSWKNNLTNYTPHRDDPEHYEFFKKTKRFDADVYKNYIRKQQEIAYEKFGFLPIQEKVLNKIKITYSNGTYYGKKINRQRTGEGVMVYNDGTITYGTWKNDLLNGNAMTVFPSGSYCYGNYTDGKKHGIIKFYDKKTDKDTVWKWIKGEKQKELFDFNNYEMSIRDYTYENGDRYVGIVIEGYRHGFGELYYASGDKYEGDFLNNRPHGHGIYTYADGSKYTGWFVCGTYHDVGTYYDKNGQEIYSGRYENGKRAPEQKSVELTQDQLEEKYKKLLLNNKNKLDIKER